MRLLVPTIATLIFAELPKGHGAGLRSLSSGASDSESRRLNNAEFDAILAYLNATFDGNCRGPYVAGGVAPGTPTTSYVCDRPGGSAILTGDGCASCGSNEPVPETLTLCQLQSKGKQDCHDYDLTSSLNALQTVKNTLGGANDPDAQSEFDELVAWLNETYTNCDTYVTGGLGTQEPITTVYCTWSGGDATLVADGATNPDPVSLTRCGFGAMMKKCCCETLNLSSGNPLDIVKSHDSTTP